MDATFPFLLAPRPHPFAPMRLRTAALRPANATRDASGLARAPQTLHASLSDLLAPAAGWGRVELGLRNSMADLRSTLERASTEVHGDDVFHLGGERHAAWLSERGIARVELVDSVDNAGGAVGLNWYDRRGQRIGSVLLSSPGGRDQALLWCRQQGRPRADAGRCRLTAAPVPVMFAPLEGLVSVDPLARGPAAAAWAQAAVLQAERADGMRLDLGCVGAALRYTGPLAALPQEPDGLQAGGPRCRLQLQPARASVAARVIDRDGVSGLLLTDDAGASLLLHPQGEGAAGWLAGVGVQAAALRLLPSPALSV